MHTNGFTRMRSESRAANSIICVQLWSYDTIDKMLRAYHRHRNNNTKTSLQRCNYDREFWWAQWQCISYTTLCCAIPCLIPLFDRAEWTTLAVAIIYAYSRQQPRATTAATTTVCLVCLLACLFACLIACSPCVALVSRCCHLIASI